MNKILLYIKRGVLSIVLIGGLGVFGFWIFVQLPTELELEISKGPNQALANLIKLAESDIPINVDPYASSTYRPGHPLYEAALRSQEGGYGQASEVLGPLVKAGDAEAAFFLGEYTFNSSSFAQLSGVDLFRKAARLGNPYAAMKLDKDNYDCKAYMPYACSHKWGEQGRKELRERAANGDAKAGYALFLSFEYKYARYEYFFDDDYTKEGRGPFQILLKAANDGVKQHYYRPLLQLVWEYRNRKSLIPHVDTPIPLSKSENENLVKLVKLAINNNDMKAVVWMNSNKELFSEDYYVSTMHRMIPFFSGDRWYPAEAFYTHHLSNEHSSRVSALARAISYGKLNVDDYWYHYEEYFIREFEKKLPFSEQEKAEANILAEEYARQYKPIIYVDETAPTKYEDNRW